MSCRRRAASAPHTRCTGGGSPGRRGSPWAEDRVVGVGREQRRRNSGARVILALTGGPGDRDDHPVVGLRLAQRGLSGAGATRPVDPTATDVPVPGVIVLV